MVNTRREAELTCTLELEPLILLLVLLARVGQGSLPAHAQSGLANPCFLFRFINPNHPGFLVGGWEFFKMFILVLVFWIFENFFFLYFVKIIRNSIYI